MRRDHAWPVGVLDGAPAVGERAADNPSRFEHGYPVSASATRQRATMVSQFGVYAADSFLSATRHTAAKRLCHTEYRPSKRSAHVSDDLIPSTERHSLRGRKSLNGLGAYRGFVLLQSSADR